MGAIASQITSLMIVYSTVYSDADQRKHQSSASLAFVTGEFPAQMVSDAENVSIWWRQKQIGLRKNTWYWKNPDITKLRQLFCEQGLWIIFK